MKKPPPRRRAPINQLASERQQTASSFRAAAQQSREYAKGVKLARAKFKAIPDPAAALMMSQDDAAEWFETMDKLEAANELVADLASHLANMLIR